MTKRQIVAALTEARHEIVKASNRLHDIEQTSDRWMLLTTINELLSITIKQLNDSISPWDA